MKRILIVFAVFFAASAAEAGRTERLLGRAWPAAPYAGVSEIGAGVGIVFTPDLSVPGNCRFYAALGFACFESADWLQVIADVNAYNIESPARPIRTLVLETHGTNGNGLKLQKGKKPTDARSYIAVAALQEILEPMGVRYVIISACNSGRLLRPEIYRTLNRDPGDPLFLPPTLGVIDATERFDADKTKVEVITPESSHIETTLVGAIEELSSPARKALAAAAKAHGVTLPEKFAISEMLIRMLRRDPALSLRTGWYVQDLSKEQTDPEESEKIFAEFVAHLDAIATRDAAAPTTLAGAR